MSRSQRANVVRAFIERTDKFDLQADGAYKHVTDDFLYQFEPKPTEIEYDYPAGGLDKTKYREFCTKVTPRFTNFNVSLSVLHFKLSLTVANL